MKSWNIRLLALLLAFLMIVPMLVACNDAVDPPENEEEEPEDDGGETKVEKEIDVYIIAGQSNAAGSTNILDANEIYADFPELKSGTIPYIWYAGNSAGNSPNNSVTYGWGRVSLGLGASSSKMGPEVGMAKALSQYYNEETGKVAGIIKYAHGGTGLVRTEVNTEAKDDGTRDGNWEPPSYREHNPDDPTQAYRGYLYRGFVEEVGMYLYKLTKMGYTKINIKGLYWMQGCNDTWRYTTGAETDKKSPDWYRDAFACLVKDWRKDLSDIMTELQGTNGGADKMPFFIGTISRSYRLDTGVAATEARNLPFIEMQKQLAEENEYCYIIDNSVYDVMVWDETQNKAVVVPGGTDSAHWGQADCYQIGQNVGNKMLEVCTDYQA